MAYTTINKHTDYFNTKLFTISPTLQPKDFAASFAVLAVLSNIKIFSSESK